MIPQFFLRVGTHAETEPYVLRRGVHDGIIVNANLLEATSGATATMVANVHHRLGAPYFIDPYTHVFTIGDLPVGLVVEKDFLSKAFDR